MPPRSAALVVALVAALGALVGCSREEASPEAFCTEVRRAPDLYRLLGSIDRADPEALEARFGAAIAAFRDLEQASPREIRPDVARLGRVVEQVLEAVERNPNDLVAVREDLGDMRDEMTGIGRSALKVVDYANRHCGIDLNRLGEGDGGAGGSTTTTIPGDPGGGAGEGEDGGG